MTPRRSLLLGLGAVLCLGVPTSAAAQCALPAALNPDLAYQLIQPDHRFSFTQQIPYWTVIGAIGDYPGDDYDVEVWTSYNGSAYPFCYADRVARSALGSGATDFVVGDFNANPYGTYYARVFCAGGGCNVSGFRGIRTWRDGGEILYVDADPVTVDIAACCDTEYPKQVVNIYDVYLNAGATYFISLSATGGYQSKAFLFRNPTGGVYWAGRSQAELQTQGCATYTAPTSGYYGLVVANDFRSGQAGSYTVGVSTQPSIACACAPGLPSNTPTATAPGPTQDFRYAVPSHPFWAAVGVSGTSDWDIQVGPGDSGSGQPGCATGTYANSTFGSFVADFVVADYNTAPLGSPLAVRSNRYSGSGGATVEFDAGADVLRVNGPAAIRAVGPDDVVEIWDFRASAEDSTLLEFAPSGADLKLLMFENPGSGLYVAGRSAATRTMTGNALLPPRSDENWRGLAVVNESRGTGYFSLRAGACGPIFPIVAEDWSTPLDVVSYRSCVPTDTAWVAAAVRSTVADWDLFQSGDTPGPAWPDCFGPAGAASVAGAGVDLIVGDFHAMPRDTFILRARQYTGGAAQPARVSWSPATRRAVVNGAAVMDTLVAYQIVSACESWLEAGVSYNLEWSGTAGSDLRLLVFANSGGGPYWAPRSARVLETTTTTSFTPAVTGWHGLVVVKEDETEASYSLRVTRDLVAVGDAPASGRSRVESVEPNPSRGVVRFTCALDHPAPVRFEVYDVSGRRVAAHDLGSKPAGRFDWTWDGRMGSGRRAGAGLYFVRMMSGSRVVDTRRIARLD